MVEQVEKTKKEIEKEQTEKIMARHKDSFNIPKIELHTHIGGCIRPTTFMELVESKNIDIELMDFYKVDIAMAFEFFKITA
jgi:adenosine deaminase